MCIYMCHRFEPCRQPCQDFLHRRRGVLHRIAEPVHDLKIKPVHSLKIEPVHDLKIEPCMRPQKEPVDGLSRFVYTPLYTSHLVDGHVCRHVGYFPHLFPAFGNLRTGTTAARISSIKTFSRRSYTLMPREGGAGSGVPARVHDQTPQLWSLSAPITPETTRVRSPVSLGVGEIGLRMAQWGRGAWGLTGHRTRNQKVRCRSGSLQHKTLKILASCEAVLRKLRDGRAVAWLPGHVEEERLAQSTPASGWCICHPKGARTMRGGGS